MKLSYEEACGLVYREARLLDSRQYDEWLVMWAGEATYHVPCNDADADPNRHITLLYLDRPGIQARLLRLGYDAYAQDPPSRMSRVVSNVEVEPVDDDPDSARVHSAFNLTELRRGEQHTFAGRVEHIFVIEDGEWRIRRKKVVLVNLDEPIGNMTFMI